MRIFPKFIIVMGVSGSGKTSVGTALAQRLGCRFIEGDSFHPAGNVAKMSAGVPLTDDDRVPWLAALNTQLKKVAAGGECAVLACSALKRAYRRSLTAGVEYAAFVFLDGSEDLIRDRMLARSGHFMSAEMLSSQFASLEKPLESEAILLDIRQPVEALVNEILAALTDHGHRQSD